MNLEEFKSLPYERQVLIYNNIKNEQISFSKLMAHRCEEDVKINYQLWLKELAYLRKLYNSDEDICRFIEYSNFKSLCVREQEEVGVRFDIDNCIKVMKELEKEIQPKIAKLEALMPKVEIVSKKKKPKDIYKKDGSMTKKWQDWLQFRVDFGIPEEYQEEEIEYVSGYSDPNAGSSSQLKDWLFSLGWEPETFVTSAPSKVTGETKEVPQIYKEDKTLCDSIVALYDVMPDLVELDNLGRLKHRLSLLKGFMEEAKEVEEGHLRLYGTISGYTNTMRLIHKKPLVNLPKVTLPYSEGIRACLITDSDKKLLCGADLSGIESVTRNHYLNPYDPEYVKELDNPMYDPHIDIGILAGFFSKEEGDLYINIDKGVITEPTDEQKAVFKRIKPLRGKAKNTNFGATYGIGKAKLSKMAKITMNEAKKLLEIYWQRNWAIKSFAQDCEVKSVGDQMWIKNPVSKFWYSLRSDKDRFSTVNQSTAVFVFDTWLRQIRSYGVKVQYQCHDELLFSLSSKKENVARSMLNESIKAVNEQLALSVTVSMSPAFGVNYAETH